MPGTSTETTSAYSLHIVLEIAATQGEGERVIYEAGVPDGRRMTLSIAGGVLAWTYHDNPGAQLAIHHREFAGAPYRHRLMYIHVELGAVSGAIELTLAVNGREIERELFPGQSLLPLSIDEMAIGASLAGGSSSSIKVARAFLYPGRIQGDDAQGLLMFMTETYGIEL